MNNYNKGEIIMEDMIIIGMIVVLILALGYFMWDFYKDVKNIINIINEELKQRADELGIELKGVDKEED